jgi:ribonuclease R
LLADIGEHTSRRERVAMEAERDIVELKKVQFMVGKVGEEFDGFISGVSAFGFFVELDEFFVEGLVHISTLKNDRYTFDENSQALSGTNSGVSFKIGDPVRIVVAAASPERRQIEFVLAGEANGVAVTAEKYPRIPVRGKKPEGWKSAGTVVKGRGRPVKDRRTGKSNGKKGRKGRRTR